MTQMAFRVRRRTPKVSLNKGSENSAGSTKTLWIKRVLFWVTKSSLVFLTSALLAEAIARLVFEEEEVAGSYWGRGAFAPSASLGYRHAPGYSGRAYRSGSFEAPVRIAARGLRQQDIPAQAAFPRRLLVLGDSFTFGLGVRESDGFAARLQAPLNARGIGVINGAQAGYCVEQERRLGQELIAAYRPNFVLLQIFVGNDIQGDYIADYKTVDVVAGFQLLGERWLPIAPVDFLRTRSYMGLSLNNWLVGERYLRVQQRFLEHARHDPAAVMQPTLKALGKLARQCAAQRQQLAVLLIPAKNDPLRFRARLVQALKAEGLPFLDLEHAALGPEDYFAGDDHWNVSGHAKVARLLVPFLETVAAVATSPAGGSG